jgi:hypothetical protein
MPVSQGEMRFNPARLMADRHYRTLLMLRKNPRHKFSVNIRLIQIPFSPVLFHEEMQIAFQFQASWLNPAFHKAG